MVREIFFKIILKGRGIVNFDSKDQKFYWNQQEGVSFASHDNNSFAKGNYRQVEKSAGAKLIKTLKISSACLRHAIHREAHPFHSPLINHDEDARLYYLANLDTFLRGYMLTSSNEKKKSCYILTDALNNSDAVSSIEVHSTASGRPANTEEGDSQNNFFFKESVGEISYLAEGSINISELKFISLDDKFDRLSVRHDSVDRYRDFLSKALGSPVAEPSYYKLKSSAYDIPEYGILLTDDQVKVLVKHLVKRLYSIQIGKSQTGYADTDSVYFKVVNDPTKDKMGDTFIDQTLDIDSIDIYNSYEEVNADEAEKKFAEIKEVEGKATEDKKQKKANKKASKKVTKKNKK